MTSKVGLLSLILLAAAVSAWAKQDPELSHCLQQCRQSERLREDQKKECERKCEDYIREKRSREGGDESWRWEEGQSEEREQQGESDENEYVFQEQHYEQVVESQEGRIRVLKKFTERSNLLKGIENYRLGFIEANPRTFIAPVHVDADTIYFVARGRATLTLLRKEKNEKEINKKDYNLESGDVLFVPAGTPIHAVNRDDNQKLFIVKFINPVSLPGRFEPFQLAGSEERESFYEAFSWNVLRAAFKREKEDIERLFRQERQQSIRKVTKEQLEELSRHAQSTTGTGGGGIAPVWPFHGESSEEETFFNLFKFSTHSNRYGRLFETDLKKFKQLKNLDLQISFANITRGNMAGPFYNSKATKISFVVEGEGHIEMACPHVSGHHQQQPHQQSGKGFRRVTGQLRRGTAFVTPAGHPIAIVAAPGSNLQVVCFEVFARDNVRYTLAGKNNLVSGLDNVAAQLTFGKPAREIERVFGNQKDELFFAGPTQQQRQQEEEEEGGRGRAYVM